MTRVRQRRGGRQAWYYPLFGLGFGTVVQTLNGVK
jgi:hypothetical protein